MSTATQTAYNQGARIGAPGDLADSGLADIATAAAAEPLKPGKFAVYCTTDGDRDKIRYPKANRATLTLSGDLGTGDTIAGTVGITTIAGVLTTTAVSEPYATSHSATADLFLADLNAITGVTAVFTDGGTKRVIQITVADDKALSFPVAIGVDTGNPTVATVLSSTDSIAGVTRIDLASEKSDAGLTGFAVGDEVGLIRQGRVFMDAETAVVNGASAVYARIVAGTALNEEPGTVRGSAGSPAVAFQISSGASIYDPAAEDGTAVVEVNFIGK